MLTIYKDEVWYVRYTDEELAQFTGRDKWRVEESERHFLDAAYDGHWLEYLAWTDEKRKQKKWWKADQSLYSISRLLHEAKFYKIPVDPRVEELYKNLKLEEERRIEEREKAFKKELEESHKRFLEEQEQRETKKPFYKGYLTAREVIRDYKLGRYKINCKMDEHVLEMCLEELRFGP